MLYTLDSLGAALRDNKEYEEAKEVWERCLAGEMKLFDEDHPDTLATLNNLGNFYHFEELREGAGVLRESFGGVRGDAGKKAPTHGRHRLQYYECLFGYGRQ